MKGKRIIIILSILFMAMLSIATVPMDGDTKTIEAKALDDHTCDSETWHFIINQISDMSLAPDFIHVTWANGAEEDVYRGQPEESNIAHYSTASNLDSWVISATAEIYSAWSGEFNLSHGPCVIPTPTPTETVEPTTTPTKTLEPTPTQTGTMEPTVTPTGTVEPTPTNTQEVFTPTPTDPPPGGTMPKNRMVFTKTAIISAGIFLTLMTAVILLLKRKII